MTDLPDLDRIISRAHSGNCKLLEFLMVIEGFQRTYDMIQLIRHSRVEFTCKRLSNIRDSFPECKNQIEYFRTAFDREQAKKEGVITPRPGVDKAFDDVVTELEDIHREFKEYLTEQKKVLRERNIQYRDLGKDPYQIEVPAHISVPTEYLLMSKTKQVRRFWTPRIKNMVRRLQEAEERKNMVQTSIFANILKQFSEHWPMWNHAVSLIAELDCLISLSKCAQILGEPLCRPKLLDRTSLTPSSISLEQFRHPCLCTTNTISNFIPNDLQLGTDSQAERVILLTGPNMGGKSTLLRQTCIAVIMAQLGCYVPAKSCTLTPIDRIFTRIGAHDNILAGHSTFMVELQETSKILQNATPDSLVILDELGRGTSTFDGYSIAFSVLYDLATRVGCLSLFSTHYHMMIDEFTHNPLIGMYHMGCEVDEVKREVTFLYRLQRGVCPRSYGMNVANMAGIPRSIVDRAESIAEAFERLTFQGIKYRQKFTVPNFSASTSSSKHMKTSKLADFVHLWRLGARISSLDKSSNDWYRFLRICSSLKTN